MPTYRIEIPGQGTFRIESPTELSDQQVYQAVMGQQQVEEPVAPKEEPGLLSQIAGTPKEFVKGAASGLVQAVGGLGALPYAAARYVAPDLKPFEETALGRTVTQAEKALAPGDEGYITQLASGLGSFASIFGPQAVLRGVGGAGRLATGIAPKLATPTALGQTTGLGVEEARQRSAIARAEGQEVTPGEELAALAIGAPIGLTELLPVEKLFKGLDTGLSEGFKFTVANLVKRGLQQGGIEGAQEVASGLMQDLSAKGIYNPNLQLGQSMFDELTVGGGVGAISQVGLDILFKRRIQDAYSRTQQKKVEEEVIRRADEARAAQAKQIATTKEQLGIKEGEMLALPAPAQQIEAKEELDPLQNPLGMFKQDQLQEGYVKAVNKMRDDQGMAKIKDLSIEDIADAGAPQGEIDRLIAGRLSEQGVDVDRGLEAGLTTKDIMNLAAQKNIDTATPGFTDFLRRTTGVSADESMSPVQRLAAFEALSRIEPSAEPQILPEGTNATRFTQEQYDRTVKSIKDMFPAEGRLGRSQVVQEIKDYSGLENDRDAQSLLQAAVRNGDFTTVSTRNFLTLDQDGKQVGIAYPDRKTAERAAKARGLSVKERTSIDIALPEEGTALPGGPDIRKGAFKEGEAPAAYEIKSDQTVLATAKTEEEARAKQQRLQTLRQNKANGLLGQIKSIDTNIAKSQQKLESMEAEGQADTVEYRQMAAKIAANNANLEAQKQRLNAEAEKFSAPLSVNPKGVKPVTREGYTLFEQGKPVATFPDQRSAEEAAITRLDDETLQKVASLGRFQKGLMPKRLAALAKEEMDRRAGKAPAGIAVKPTKTVKEAEEKLADLGIFTPKFKQKADELEKKLRPVLDKLGLKDLRLNIVRAIQTPMGEADGSYAEKLVTIALNADNPIRTLRHEAIHALKELGAFTDAQWKVLEKAAKEKWLGKYGIAQRYKGLTQAEQIEEAIADAFSDFDQTKPPPGLIGALFNKIKKFFEAMGNAMRGMGFQTAEDVFANVEKGVKLPEGVEAGKEIKYGLKEDPNRFEIRKKEAFRGRTTADVEFQLYKDGKLLQSFARKKDAQQMLDIYTLPDEQVYEKYPELKPAEKYAMRVKEPVSPLEKYVSPQEAQDRLRRRAARSKDTGQPSNDRLVFGTGKDKLVIGKITIKDWKDRVDNTMSLDEVEDARAWYQQLSDFFDPIFGEQASDYALAWLLSQKRASPTKGFADVLRASDLAADKIRIKKAGLNEKALVAALRKEVPEEGIGAKLLDFIDSELGKTTRTVMGGAKEGRQPAAIDVWAQRDIGFVDETVQKFVAKKYGQKAANLLDVDTARFGEPQYEYGVDFYNDVADYLNRQRYMGGGWTAREVQAVGWVNMQKFMGVQPEFVRDIINGNTRRVSIGLAPGTGTAMTARLMGKEIPTKEAQRVISDLADIANVKVTQSIDGVGAYLTFVEGSIQVDAVGSPESVDDFMDMVGYAFQQTEVINTRPLASGKNSAIDILSPSLNTQDKAIEFFTEYLKAMPKDSDGNPIAPGFQQVKVDGVPGIRLVNFDGKWGKRQLEALAKASEVAEQATGIKDAEFVDMNVVLTSTKNDWTKYPNGEKYVNSLRNRGRLRETELLQREYPPTRFDLAGDGTINWRPRLAYRPTEPVGGPSTGGGIVLGEKQPEAVSTVGVHYSKEPNLTVLNSNRYGTGIKGAEAARLAQSRDPRIKNRVYFYLTEEGAPLPPAEGGLGNDVYTQKFDNMLSQGDEMQRMYNEVGKDLNRFESAVVDAGYDGYAIPSMDMMVILNHDTPVNYQGKKQDVDPKKIKYSLKAPDTKEFREWFDDSKVVDENGEPLLMYHGTPLFEGYIFKPFETKNRAGNIDGYYFTSRSDDASDYAGLEEGAEIIPVFLSIQNPYVPGESPVTKAMRDQYFKEMVAANNHMSDERAMEYAQSKMYYLDKNGIPLINAIGNNGAAFQRIIQAGGYDGYQDGIGSRHWVAFEPNQIKSAFAKKPTLASKDIRYSLKQNIDPLTAQAIDRTTTTRQEEGFGDRIAGAFSPTARARFRQGMINKYEGIERLTKAKAEKFGDKELLADVSSIAAALFSDRAAGVAASSFRNGVPVYEKGYTNVSDLNGTVKGLIPIFEPLMKYNDPYIFQMFQYYAGTRRGKRLDAEGREKLFTPDDIKRGQALAAQYPEFETAFDEYQKYNQGLVKFLKDTGVISDKEAQVWTQNWDYIPFYRQMDGEETVGPRVFSAISGVAKPKKLKGGEAPLADFMETIVRNSRAAIEAGMKNVASQRVVRDVVSLGLGQEVPARDAIGTDIVTVKENGLTKYYKVADPLLVESVKGLNLPQLPFLDILSKPAEALRNLVTKDPGFMLANLMRDSLQAWVTTGQNMTPIIDTFKQYGAALANMSPEARALAQAGLFTGYDFAGDVKATSREVEKELRKRSGKAKPMEIALWPVTKVWEALEKGSTASDVATRAEVYKRVLKETGNEAEAMYQAMEVLNFSRRGNSALIRVLTAVVPFMNARIQGLDVLYRAGFGEMASQSREIQQKAFITRSLTIMGLSALYWALASDSEEYKTAEPEARDNYWIMGNVRIPIPFEIGTVFKVFPERILEYWFGQDTGKDLKESIIRNATSTLAFNPIPQAVLPIIENVANYSFFTGQPIVSKGMEDVAPRFQSTTGTSLLAKEVGEATNQSPIKIDNLIRGYTGTLGTYIVLALDSIMRNEGDPTKAAMRAEQMPVIKRFYASEKGTGTITAYYELKKQVEEATRTINYLERTGKPEDIRSYLEDKGAKLLAVKPFIQAMDKDMTQLRELRQSVLVSKMDPERKREVLDNIRNAEVNLTSRIQLVKKQLS